MHAVAARYSQMPDIDRGEALQAIADYLSIAKSLAENGYDSVEIKVEVHYLHEEKPRDDSDEQASVARQIHRPLRHSEGSLMDQRDLRPSMGASTS